MTPLGWGYAALVWGYALVWFLLTDRIKLVAYRILDPVKIETAALTGTPTTEPGSSTGTPKGVAHPSTVAPFHSDADSGDPVYHDRSDCPYGREIKNNGNDKPGTDDGRLCDWCARGRTSAA
jgi:H+-transporting ATPase